MTALTAPVIPLRRSPRRGPYVRTVTWLVRAQVKVALWFAGILALLWVAAVLIASTFGPIGMSIMQFARQGAGVWFPFSIAISFVAAALRPHVAAGMTRRVFAWAAITATVVMSAVYGGVLTLGFMLEGAVYRANGWEQAITEVTWSFVRAGDTAAVLGDATLLIAVASMSGLLVGSVYLRYGGWVGTLTLPFTVGPVFASLAILSREIQIDGLTQPARIAVVVGAAVVLAALFAAVVRTTPIAPPKG